MPESASGPACMLCRLEEPLVVLDSVESPYGRVTVCKACWHGKSRKEDRGEPDEW